MNSTWSQFEHIHILGRISNLTKTSRCLFSLKKSVLGNSQNIYQHLRGVWALRNRGLRRRKVVLFLSVSSLCDAEIEGYAGEVQCVILSKALIFSACTSISFEFLYDVCLDPITSPMLPSTKGFAVFCQSLWAFSSSVVRMLNYKEHQAALFQDVVCYSKTIKCLY